MKLSLNDQGDLQGQRQGAQSKISVIEKKKRYQACSRKVVCQAETQSSGRLEWVLSQDGEDTARLEIRHTARCLCTF